MQVFNHFVILVVRYVRIVLKYCMATLNERIKEMRIANGHTLLAVAKQLGISEANMQRYESGQVKNIPHKNIVKLAAIFNCSPSLLMGWENDPKEYRDQMQLALEKASGYLTEEASRTGYPIARMFPVLKGLDSAKHPKDLGIVGIVECPNGLNAGATLQCPDNSMVNAHILEGDVVFFSIQDVEANGEIVVVLTKDGLTIRHYYRYGNRVVLHAENPIFKDIEFDITKTTDVHIVGKSVAILRGWMLKTGTPDEKDSKGNEPRKPIYDYDYIAPLNPCKCGHKSVRIGADISGMWFITCNNDYEHLTDKAEHIDRYYSKKEAIEGWNKRNPLKEGAEQFYWRGWKSWPLPQELRATKLPPELRSPKIPKALKTKTPKFI